MCIRDRYNTYDLASLERYDSLYLLLFLIFSHPFLFLIFMFSAFFFKGVGNREDEKGKDP